MRRKKKKVAQLGKKKVIVIPHFQPASWVKKWKQNQHRGSITEDSDELNSVAKLFWLCRFKQQENNLEIQ